MLATLKWFAAAVAFAAMAATATAADSWVRTEARAGDFPLVRKGHAATLLYSERDAKVVSIAVQDLAADIARVTGAAAIARACDLSAEDSSPVLALKTCTSSAGSDTAQPLVIVGTLGRNALIDEWVRAGKLETGATAKQWESFVIAVVERPMAGIEQALVIAGSDRRGTAYGVYELSQAIGVSPWYWWADVPPHQQAKELYVSDVHRFGPPSVKYRGIFINDEDWGLRPWAAKTFEPGTGNIGPKTYRKIFELLLRLKANTLWPAMHPGTTPFNAIAQNRQLADDYAIVMGSSHAEPMLRNNVGEWQVDPEKYNYVTNRDGVRAYWEQRIRENARYENSYTLGMRGIHDSNMQGPKTDAERIRVLEQVFADQRAMLMQHVGAPIEQIPQVFVAYKEVLGLYRQGLKVPADVSLVWPDDNFGFIRNYATPEEHTRPGGFGVYYHLSYLGRPLSYLWLSTTPPALIWEEMTKAYDHGARTLWIANVGDLKPAEIGTEFFLQLGWNAGLDLKGYLPRWAEREFGPEHAREIAAVMNEFYRLNAIRKPEHLQWWLPREAPRPSPFSQSEIDARLQDFRDLQTRADKVYAAMPASRRDAFFQLVAYPVRGAALANARYFFGEQFARQASQDSADSQRLAQLASAADTALREQTRLYNESVANGKWRHMMSLEPADSEWSSMRIAKWQLPRYAARDRSNRESVLDRRSHAPVGRKVQGHDEPGTRVASNNEATRNEHGSSTSTADETARKQHGGSIVNSNEPTVDERGNALVEASPHIDAGAWAANIKSGAAGWQIIPGLGHTGRAVAVFPTTAQSIDLAQAAERAPRLEYDVQVAKAGALTVTVHLLPTRAIIAEHGLRLAVGLDEQPPAMIRVNIQDDSAEWAQSVLNASVPGAAPLSAPSPGAHKLKVYMIDPGVVLDRITLEPRAAAR
jgi:Glycosyl hydrolase family 115/Gylcosyl hydrolase family 115 C-terminal domain